METFFRVMHVGQRASGKRLTTVGHEPRFEILVNLHISINKDFHDYFLLRQNQVIILNISLIGNVSN